MSQFSRASTLGLCVATISLCGCSQEEPTGVPVLAEAARATNVEEVEASEVYKLINQDKRPLLVELSVTSGCFRCNELNAPMRLQTAEIKRYADVVRVNYNKNPKLVNAIGATVCPSYAVFSGGGLKSIRSWPTSASLVVDDVLVASEDRRTSAN